MPRKQPKPIPDPPHVYKPSASALAFALARLVDHHGAEVVASAAAKATGDPMVGQPVVLRCGCCGGSSLVLDDVETYDVYPGDEFGESRRIVVDLANHDHYSDQDVPYTASDDWPGVTLHYRCEACDHLVTLTASRSGDTTTLRPVTTREVDDTVVSCAHTATPDPRHRNR